MNIRIYAIVESGETKKDVERQLKDKIGLVMPELSDCIEKKHERLCDGSRNSEFLVDADVLIRRIKQRIDCEVIREMEAYKTKLKQQITSVEAV